MDQAYRKNCHYYEYFLKIILCQSLKASLKSEPKLAI